MLLSKVQRRAIFKRHGTFPTEACDRCGRVLGLVRFTLPGKPGAWCSKRCRDGFSLFSGQGVCRNCGGPLPERATEDSKHCSKECAVEGRAPRVQAKSKGA